MPKIPSVRITDLVEAMSGKRQYDIIGIRPGEKLHEVMVPEKVAHHTLEYNDHYGSHRPLPSSTRTLITIRTMRRAGQGRER